MNLVSIHCFAGGGGGGRDGAVERVLASYLCGLGFNKS